MKVVIVGSGPGGLVSLTNFQSLFKPNEIEVVCYERRDQVGGEWIDMMDREETYDKFGLPLRTNMYREMRLNTPTLLYPPYPHQSFPPETSVYPTQAEMYNYLKRLSDSHNLEQYIKFNKMVTDISFDKDTSKFSMKVHDLNSEDVTVETSDYVMLCVGKFSLPRKPDIDMSKFTGEWFHYHELRDPNRMAGKRILVVGSSWGAMDMNILLNKPGRAKSFHLTYRNNRPMYESGANLTSIHPWLTAAEGNRVFFKDGSHVDVDAVIFCNGFNTAFPVAEDLQIDFEVGKFSRHVHPLYKDFVHPKCPKLYFIGMPRLSAMYVAHPLSILIAKIIKGEFTLPGQAEMEEDIKKFENYWNQEFSKKLTEEEKDSYFPLAEFELTVSCLPHEMCPDVPRVGPEYMRQICYQFLYGIRHDCLNYKFYVHEFRPDPKDPERKIPFLIPKK